MAKKQNHQPEPDHHGIPFALFMEEFILESDRAAVILGAAKIDSLLAQVLDRYLLPCPSATDDLLEGDAPLGTFSSRIKACHRLGLIDDQFAKLLNTFRRLRNEFAHEVSAGTLASGSARDRVLAMADVFAGRPFYVSLLRKIAGRLERDIDDPGVIFRAVLALFYLELGSIHEGLIPAQRMFTTGIVENCEALESPEATKKRSTARLPTDGE